MDKLKEGNMISKGRLKKEIFLNNYNLNVLYDLLRKGFIR